MKKRIYRAGRRWRAGLSPWPSFGDRWCVIEDGHAAVGGDADWEAYALQLQLA
jgi:hypothetical protein